MFRHLLAGYSTLEDRYDELLSASGVPRAHWAAFLQSMAAREGLEISETLALMEREIRENGVTYNVYADPQGADRLWEVDPLPLLLSAAEWSEIEAGIAQRADLLNRVLADLYGPPWCLGTVVFCIKCRAYGHRAACIFSTTRPTWPARPTAIGGW